MKKGLLIVGMAVSMATTSLQAQAQPTGNTEKTQHEIANGYIRQGDYDNALVVLNKALEKDPNNLELGKDLEFVYFLQRNFAKAIEVGKPLTERADADEQSFQLLGLSYKATALTKECKKLYKAALQKFPQSGVLYNEYGELLRDNNEADESIIQFEKGIQANPNYSSNYYNAVKYYSQQQNPSLFWIVMLGENFVNLESYTARTTEVKRVLLEGYKKLFSTGYVTSGGNNTKAGEFEKKVLATLNNSSSAIAEGITTNNLTALRTKMILEWFKQGNNTAFPFRLFDHQQQLIKEGIFDAYNQWLFGSIISPSGYELWQSQHEGEQAAFKKFQTGRIYKVPEGQFYK